MKKLPDFIKEEIKENELKRILDNLEKEGKITKKEKFLIRLLKNKGWEFHPAYFIKELAEYGDIDLTEKDIEKYFEKEIRDGILYLKVKEDFVEKVDRLIREAQLRESLKDTKLKVGTKVLEIPPKSECEVIFLGVKTREIMDKWGLKQIEVSHYVYLLHPNRPIPAILISEEELPEGRIELRLKELSREDLEQIMDIEEWIFLLKRVTIFNRLFKKDELRNELLRCPNSKIKVFKVFKVTERFLKELSVEELEHIKNKAINGFESRWGKIILGLAIRPPKFDWILPYTGTHCLIIDRTNMGKTLAGHLIGRVRDRVTIANLIGYATSQEVHKSILDGRNDPLFIDELEEEKRELGSYLLNLLKYGKIEVSVGRASNLITKYWGSLVFTANAKGKTPEEMGKKLVKLCFKISPNMEGLASRLAFIDYYVFDKEFQGEPMENLKYRELFTGIGEKLGEIYALLLKREKGNKIYNWVRRSKWEEFYISQLRKIKEGTTLPEELQIFIDTLPENYIKLNCLALKIALWEFLDLINRDLFEIDLDDYIPKILDKSEENKKMLQAITVQSFHNLAQISIWDVIIEEKLKRLTIRGRRFLKFVIFAFNKGYNLIDQHAINSDTELEDTFIKLFGESHRYISKVISKLTDENKTILESFGIKIYPNYVIIDDEWKLKKVEEIFGGENNDE